jgi:hypothetical protein
MGEAETQWGDRLPGSPEMLYRWLLGQPDGTLMELLAYCTARSFSAVVGRARTLDHSDAMAEALGVDMADWVGGERCELPWQRQQDQGTGSGSGGDGQRLHEGRGRNEEASGRGVLREQARRHALAADAASAAMRVACRKRRRSRPTRRVIPSPALPVSSGKAIGTGFRSTPTHLFLGGSS